MELFREYRDLEASGLNREKGRGGKSGLTGDVVESLPASEDVKRQTGQCEKVLSPSNRFFYLKSYLRQKNWVGR